MPFVSFNKSDRLGMIADWTGDTYSDKRMLNKYQVQYGSHSHYNQYDDDEAFQLVDQNRNQRTGNQRGRIRVGQRNMRNRNQKNNPNNLQVLRARNARNPRGNSRFGHRGGGNRRYDPKNQAKKRDASVNIRPEWKILEEMDFPRLGKLSLPGIGDAKDIYTCGSLEYYDKSYDRVNCKNEKRLQRINRIHHKVTTTDDPIIRKLSKTDGTVYATDAIISTLMCATRSVASWDIIVNRVGNKLFFDKRDDSEFDLLTVNETAADPPFNEESNSINNPRSLALEATYINHNFSQQVLKNTDKKEEKYCFENKNPFVSEEDESDVASVAYRYRKFDLGDGVELVVRCEHDAVTVGTNGSEQFMNIKALNEWDSRVPGAIDWRQKLDIQRGAVLANELKNNSCKLAKWTVQALLAGSDHIKFGYVSRVHFRDSAKHAILGTQQFKPREFADQTNLNLDNAWGVLRCIIDTCMKLDQGKYLILKDPNKQTLLIYDIPDDTFETDNEDDDDEEDIEEEDEDEKEEEVTGK
ncbi:PREDICTED: eukaryotic translation initiation factor 3 subunit D-like [Rhagoletis zephyria]|uniref:eukaryotic translation initiation factor 3 subunit D-like n=1 Tax=Rhagoletis zephyria TaxID=28612 RepID=UPI00081122AC|nr:PREDICTED: eukaryotic translation initiation factor 3 subunit D-like [Rhagoletis zephyria]